jgi:hypothetical protein
MSQSLYSYLVEMDHIIFATPSKVIFQFQTHQIIRNKARGSLSNEVSPTSVEKVLDIS